MTELIIIRGIPGSGKTTLAKKVFSNHKLIEADQYFTDEKGNYNFVPYKIKSAHDWCFKKTSENLRNGVNTVLANTFTKKWEYARYVSLAEALGVKYTVIVANGTYNNVHDVPQDVIANMKERFEL